MITAEVKKEEMQKGRCNCTEAIQCMVVKSTGKCVDCELDDRAKNAERLEKSKPAPVFEMNKGEFEVMSKAVRLFYELCREKDMREDLEVSIEELGELRLLSKRLA